MTTPSTTTKEKTLEEKIKEEAYKLTSQKTKNAVNQGIILLNLINPI
jgi:hypothetical protein